MIQKSVVKDPALGGRVWSRRTSVERCVSAFVALCFFVVLSIVVAGGSAAAAGKDGRKGSALINVCGSPQQLVPFGSIVDVVQHNAELEASLGMVGAIGDKHGEGFWISAAAAGCGGAD